jgi:hypothetical protein
VPSEGVLMVNTVIIRLAKNTTANSFFTAYTLPDIANNNVFTNLNDACPLCVTLKILVIITEE